MQLNAIINLVCPACNIRQNCTTLIDGYGFPYALCDYSKCRHKITGDEYAEATELTVKNPDDLRIALKLLTKNS
ncbi:hypothetical protein GCM10023149_31040 [Mucilaginibacter gynuensis]|uniref:Uncharacterized protein n=1 Tax=Mucilaginibacter gynuensis TaxID=1302236 RepID=A0ABP8GNK6_9SPHI